MSRTAALLLCLTLLAASPAFADDGDAPLDAIDAFVGTRLRTLAALKTEEGPKREAQRAAFTSGLQALDEALGAMTVRVDALYTEAERRALTADEERELFALEYRRDFGEFVGAEGCAKYATSFEAAEPRAHWSRSALERYDAFLDERGSPRLLLHAGLNRGDLLVDLERYPAAIEQFSDLRQAELPFRRETDAARRAVEAEELDVIIRAHAGWTRALTHAKRHAEAVAASLSIDELPRAKRWTQHAAAWVLTIERAKALVGVGRGAEGAALLYGLIEDSQDPGVGQPETKALGRVATAACLGLSELSDLSSGEIYVAPVQFHVGVGYLLRGRTSAAIAAFKGVLTSARSAEDRRVWIPAAAREVGGLLFRQERYLEAALAYQALVTEFPSDERAPEAGVFAISAGKRAVEQFGEARRDRSTPVARFARELEIRFARGCFVTRAKLLLRDAADLHEQRRWLAAAEAYLKVPREGPDKSGVNRPVRFFSNARANAGLCYLLAYGKTGNGAHLALARSTLTEATQVAVAGGDAESEALARLYLGRLENEQRSWAAALDALSPFDGSLQESSRYLVRARYQQARAHVELGALDDARARFDAIRDRRTDAGYGDFGYFLAHELSKAASKAETVEDARGRRRQAADLIRCWVQSDALESRRAAVVYWVANTLFRGGDYRGALDAYRIFCTTERLAPNTKQGLRENHRLDRAELRAALCQLMLGDAQQAFDGLRDVARIAYVYQGRGARRRAVGRGLLADRSLSAEAFTFKRNGRELRRQVWFTSLKIDGETLRFFDAHPPRDGTYLCVQGDDPTAAFDPSVDTREIELELKGDPLLVEGLARASWAVWRETADAQLLADELSAATNDLIVWLRHGEEAYPALARRNQVVPATHASRLWEARVQFLEIKFAREDYRGVVAEIDLLGLRGELSKASADQRERLAKLHATALRGRQ